MNSLKSFVTGLFFLVIGTPMAMVVAAGITLFKVAPLSVKLMFGEITEEEFRKQLEGDE